MVRVKATPYHALSDGPKSCECMAKYLGCTGTTQEGNVNIICQHCKKYMNAYKIPTKPSVPSPKQQRVRNPTKIGIGKRIKCKGYVKECEGMSTVGMRMCEPCRKYCRDEARNKKYRQKQLKPN